MSPFKSSKQRSYLRREKPKVYKKWAKKYSVKVRGSSKKRGTTRK